MYIYQLSHMAGLQRRSGNNHGIALVTALMFIVVLALLGVTTATVTTLSSQSSGNYKATIQSLQVAEAGTEEARARLRVNAAPTSSRIADTATPPDQNWQAFIGTTAQAQAYGYTGSSQPVNSLQTALQYAVVIAHAKNAAGQILYWGAPNGTGVNRRNTTTGKYIYLVTSHGPFGGANSTVRTQVARVPDVPLTGTLYVDAPTTLQGSSTYINGMDQCGNTNLPGVTTPLAQYQNGDPTNPTIDLNGGPTVLGANPGAYQYGRDPALDIPWTVQTLANSATDTYTFSSNTTVTDTSWGTPTVSATLDTGHGQENVLGPCPNSESHVVYYDMTGNNPNVSGAELRLHGGTQGCGILLVKGNLRIDGSFSWYGPVIVTGSIIYTGGASASKNVTGALLSGGSVQADVIGGNAAIINCSAAMFNATQNLPPLVLNWEQIY